MPEANFSVDAYLNGFICYCSLQGCINLQAASDIARKVLEPQGLFQITPLALESSGIPIEIVLEDIVLAVFSAVESPVYSSNKLLQYMRDYSIECLESLPDGRLRVNEYFPHGDPPKAEPMRRNGGNRLGKRIIMTDWMIDKKSKVLKRI